MKLMGVRQLLINKKGNKPLIIVSTIFVRTYLKTRKKVKEIYLWTLLLNPMYYPYSKLK